MEVINGNFGKGQETDTTHMGKLLQETVDQLGVQDVEEGNFMVLLSTDTGFSIASSKLSGASAAFMLDMARSIIIDAALQDGPDFNNEED